MQDVFLYIQKLFGHCVAGPKNLHTPQKFKSFSMRPNLDDNEKRRHSFILRMSKEEKQVLKAFTREGKFPCMSDFVRSRIFQTRKRTVVEFDPQTTKELQKLDFELNKIGVNLNQLSKRMNSFAGYQVDDRDRELIKAAQQKMVECLAFLQRKLR